MAIYNGAQKVKPSGIAKVYVGSQLVYQASTPSPIPTDYRILEYIQSGSSGDCALNLNFYATGETVVEAELTFISANWGWARAYGTKPSSATKYNLHFNNNNPGNNQCYVSPNYGSFDPGTSSNTIISKNVKYKYKQENGNLYIDDVLQPGASTSAATFTSPVSFYVCGVCSNNSTVDSGSTNLKVYSFKVWDGSTPLRNLIPVQRKSDNVNGMYDIVNNVFYSSITAINFTAGPIVDENA